MGPIARASCFMPCLLEGAVAAVVTRVHTCSHCSFICWLLVVASVSCGCEVAASHVQLYQETYDASTKSLGDSMASPTSPTCEDFCYNWLNVNPVYVLKSQYCSDLMGGTDPVVSTNRGKSTCSFSQGVRPLSTGAAAIICVGRLRASVWSWRVLGFFLR